VSIQERLKSIQTASKLPARARYKWFPCYKLNDLVWLHRPRRLVTAEPVDQYAPGHNELLSMTAGGRKAITYEPFVNTFTSHRMPSANGLDVE
jgi:hypothetical protein